MLPLFTHRWRAEPATVDAFDGSEGSTTIDAFDGTQLPGHARLRVEVIHRVQGMPLAERALTSLHERHLPHEPPVA